MLNFRSLLNIAVAIVQMIAVSQSIPSVAAPLTSPLVATKDHTLKNARYLGGVGNNEARATAFAKNGDIFVGGNFANMQMASGKSQVFNGAKSNSPGKLLRLSPDGNQILNQIALGQRIDGIQVVRDRIVVSGDFGSNGLFWSSRSVERQNCHIVCC
jgi:hypothetical protein